MRQQSLVSTTAKKFRFKREKQKTVIHNPNQAYNNVHRSGLVSRQLKPLQTFERNPGMQQQQKHKITERHNRTAPLT